MKYLENYVEGRIPHRRLFSNNIDALMNLNKYIEESNVSISPWYFAEVEQKYNSSGIPTRIGPKYSSAIINKLFFDIDCLDKEGNIIEGTVESMYKLWDWSSKHDYRREFAFTSGGYQIVIYCKAYAEIYENIIFHLRDKLGLIIDENVSLAGMRRIVGSYNFGNDKKSKRHLHCISLRHYEIYDGFEKHKLLAATKRKERNVYGWNVYKPKNIKVRVKKRTLDRKTDFTSDSSVDDILLEYGWCYEDICHCMKAIIEQPRVKHTERIIIIKYLKDIFNIKYSDILVLLPKLFTAKHGSGNDGTHCIEEKQPDSIYSNNYKFNPKKMRLRGYCDIDCDDCDRYLKDLWRLSIK